MINYVADRKNWSSSIVCDTGAENNSKINNIQIQPQYNPNITLKKTNVIPI